MENINNEKVKVKKRYIPSSFLVIIALMILFIFTSWIGYAIDSSKITGIGILDVASAIWRGFQGKVEVILFIFSIGGTLGVMTKLKAIDAGIDAVIRKIGDKTLILIPILMVIFGLGGTTYGLWEETIAFIPVLVPVFRKAGYGTFTAILVILIGAGVGCLASTINPFSVGVGVSAANINSYTVGETTLKGIQLVDGQVVKMTTSTLQGTRWLSFVFFEMLAIGIVTWMATRYKKGISGGFKTDQAALTKAKGTNMFTTFFTRPRVVEGLDEEVIAQRFKPTKSLAFTWKRKISLALFIFAFILMVLMYIPWYDFANLDPFIKSYDQNMWWFASTSSAGFAKLGQWWFVSVAATFLIITLVIFAINFNEFKSDKENAEQGFVKTYMGGIKDMVGVSLLIGVAGGLGIILQATKIGTLIAEESAKGLKNLVAFGVVIFFVSIVLSLLVPSTSGFAGAFMPTFAGIAIQAFPNNAQMAIAIAVLGFIFANGLANFVTPTSAALMGYTQYAGIPYNVWLKQTWKLVLALFLLSLFIIVVFSAAAAGGSGLF